MVSLLNRQNSGYMFSRQHFPCEHTYQIYMNDLLFFNQNEKQIYFVTRVHKHSRMVNECNYCMKCGKKIEFKKIFMRYKDEQNKDNILSL